MHFLRIHYFLVILCLVVLLLLAPLRCNTKLDFILKDEKERNEQLCNSASYMAHTLNSIFETSFARQNLTIYLNSNYAKLSESGRFLVNDILRKFLINRPGAVVPNVINKQLTDATLAMRVQVQLHFIENLECILFDNSTVARKTRYFIVLLYVAPKAKLLELMSKIFAHFFHAYYNINVDVLIDADGMGDGCDLELYTFYPYTPTRCESTVPILLQHFNRTHRALDFNILYPDKLLNLHGCDLSVVVWHIPPYVELNWTDARIDGLDATILKTIAKKLNFTLQLHANEPPDLLGGQIYMNGTMTGAYRMVYERRANITLGCSACTPARTHFLTPTMPYFQMTYAIVLKSAHPYTAYEVMFFPYTISTWIVVAICTLVTLFSRNLRQLLFYCCCSRRRCCGRRHQHHHHHHRRDQYGETHIQRSILRPFYGGALFGFFILRSTYESCVFEFVHNTPVKPLPRNMEQLMAQGYSVITDHATYRMTETIPRLHEITEIVAGQPMDVFDALYDDPRQRVGAFSSNAFLAYHITMNRTKRDRYVLMQEMIVENMICMYFPRDSYLASAINVQLLNMRSFGLFGQFAKRFDYATLPPTTATVQRGGSGAGKTMLEDFKESMQFIKAALNCLLLVEAVALCICVLEYLSLRVHWLAYIFERI